LAKLAPEEQKRREQSLKPVRCRERAFIPREQCLLPSSGLKKIFLWFARAEDDSETAKERAEIEWKRYAAGRLQGLAHTCSLADQVLPSQLRRFAVRDYIGSGDFGLILRVGDRKTGAVRIMKVSVPDPRGADEEQEYLSQLRLAERGLAPAVVERFQVVPVRGKPLTILLMDELAIDMDGAFDCVDTEREALQLCDGIADVLQQLRAMRITHGDMHFGNIMLRDWTSKRVFLVDLARTRFDRYMPEIDHLQLWRSLLDTKFVALDGDDEDNDEDDEDDEEREPKEEPDLAQADRFMARILRGAPMRREIWKFYDDRDLRYLMFKSPNYMQRFAPKT
jgi:hypothetical protein